MKDFNIRKTVHIIYLNYLTADGQKMSIGGIQTYITNLSVLFIELGLKVAIYQKSSIPFHKIYDNKEVYGIPTVEVKSNKIGKDLFDFCLKRYDKSNDLLIFGCDSLICNTKGIRFIAIQHGITWDKPVDKNRTYWMLKKFYKSYIIINRIEKADTVVCVDNNFINWYRSMVSKAAVKLINIPNFSKVYELIKKPDDKIIRIIFARRLFDYRGTRIFTKSILKLIDKFNNIDVTIAGDGPDKEWMKDQFKKFNNVHFITYSSEDSLSIHADKDIAVIPTLGSEGTSLSLLEAMSTQCAIICTNVGGMTNIIIDHYNGLMINPDEESLFNAMIELVSNVELRRKISLNGFEILKDSYSLSKWKQSWAQVVKGYL